MKKSSLLLLFLLISSLALVTAPGVRAETQYYGVRFDGVDDYAVAPLHVYGWNGITIIEFVRVKYPKQNTAWSKASMIGDYWSTYASTFIGASNAEEYTSLWVEWDTRTSSGTRRAYTVSIYKYKNIPVQIVRRFDNSSREYDVFVNAQRVYSVSIPSDEKTILDFNSSAYQKFVLGGNSNGVENLPVDYYVILVYNRAISDAEIQQIYQNPLNPPTNGLVLEYLPSSVDTLNNVWKDLSGQGNDGTISGASYVPLRLISEALQSEARMLNLDGNQVVLGDRVAFSLPYQLSTLSIVMFVKPDVRDFAEWTDAKWNWYLYCSNESNLISLEIGHYNTGTFRTKLYYTDGTWWDAALPVNEQPNAFHLYYSIIDSDNNELSEGVFDESITRVGALSAKFRGVKGCRLGYADMTVVSLLIYARALNSTELKQLYENPLNPPKDGLVLWYSPYSYDFEAETWRNVAPIFQTLNLSEELDAVNYGAIPVNVSIPKVQAYDATNNSEISVYNLTVKTTNGETFIPWFMPLPYNQTITLNVSAVGYKPSIVSVQAPIDNLVFYLYPSQVITSWERPGLNVNLDNITADEYLPDASKDIDKFSSLFTRWLGGEYFKWLLSLDLEGMLKDFFNNPPIPGLGILVALMIWAAAVLITWIYFEEPEPVFVEGNIVYFGLMQFIDVSPGILAVPLGVFILFLGYKQLYKALKVWAKR